jgi:hypothetical protein
MWSSRNFLDKDSVFNYIEICMEPLTFYGPLPYLVEYWLSSTEQTPSREASNTFR